MKQNTSVETAQKSQATNNIQPEKVKNALKKIDDIRKSKNNAPTTKVVSLKETEARKKAREESYKNFRIGCLRRRCKNMKMSEEDIEKAVKKLIEQLEQPNDYQILIMFNKPEINLAKEALKNANINARILADNHAWIDGDENLLKKLREILPPKVKIHPYVKKKPPILEKNIPDKEKKPTTNTKARKTAAKAARKAINMMNFVARKKTCGKAAAKAIKRKTLLEIKRQKKAKRVQIPVAKRTSKKAA